MAALRQGESLQGPGKTMPDLKEHEMGFWEKKKKRKSTNLGVGEKALLVVSFLEWRELFT